MTTDQKAKQRQADVVVNAVQVGRRATSVREDDPVPEDDKPATTAKGQEQIAAVTEELAAAGVTVRWR